jgi:hypothetical protein
MDLNLKVELPILPARVAQGYIPGISSSPTPSISGRHIT